MTLAPLLTVNVPELITWSLAAPLNSKLLTAPAFKVNEPKFRMPTPLLPGARMAPLFMVTAPPTVPVPARVAPLFTTTLPARDPLTANVPPLFVVEPV